MVKISLRPINIFLQFAIFLWRVSVEKNSQHFVNSIYIFLVNLIEKHLARVLKKVKFIFSEYRAMARGSQLTEFEKMAPGERIKFNPTTSGGHYHNHHIHTDTHTHTLVHYVSNGHGAVISNLTDLSCVFVWPAISQIFTLAVCVRVCTCVCFKRFDFPFCAG